MHFWGVVLHLSHEAREWAKILIPAFVLGWHTPQPFYMNFWKKKEIKPCGPQS
jgi:hypothetical protein